MYRSICRILVVGCALSNVSSHALDVQQYVERGVELIEQGQFGLARSYLEPAIIHPDLVPSARSRAYYLRGFSYLAQDMFVSARKDFNRALEFNPGNAVVLTELGRLHAEGRGTPENAELAFALFEEAASSGYAAAQYQLGYAYLYGRGVQKNVIAAQDALRLAADQGHVFAMLNLAASYRERHVADPQPDIAKAWYLKAHGAGEANALMSVGFMHANGEFGEPDMAAAIDYFQQALDAGSLRAGVHLAYAYLVGEDVPQSDDRAFKLYSQAAQGGVVPAYVGLGHLYEHGLGVVKDLKQAQQWYERAAQRRDEDAIARLVDFHLRRDDDSGRAEALRWSKAGAELGTAQAQNAYAWLLATSKADELRNGNLALDQARKAVAQRSSPAFLDTLAAAYAELGDFEQAVAAQQQALAKIPAENVEMKNDFERRLRHYERSQPWRE